MPQPWRRCKTRRDTESCKDKSTSSSCHSRIPKSKSGLETNKPKKQNKKPLVSVFMFIQLFEQIQRLKELGIREEVAPNSRTQSWMASWVSTAVAERWGRSTFYHQQDKLLTLGRFPSGWFSMVIFSDPGHLCCRRPSWTSHWQATCATTEFCRISTTYTDLDNVFFQKPGLSFKQSIILPAYQFPQDCEEGKGKNSETRCLEQQHFHLGLNSGDVRQDSVCRFINGSTRKEG